MDADQTWVAFGDTVKFLDAEETKVGGYLVRFSGASDPDLTREFFTKDTDFGRDDLDGYEMPLHYQHGMDPAIGKARIGNGRVQKQDAGLWYEAQVAISDEYRDYVRQLIRDGRLGYSSGAVAHLVEKAPAGKGVAAIVRWPLGEASLTPNPAEPRNIVSLKSLLEPDNGNAISVPEDVPQDAEQASATSAVNVEPADIPGSDAAKSLTADPQRHMEQDNTGVPSFTEADVDAKIAAAVEAVKADLTVVKNTIVAPPILKTRGDSQTKAIEHWMRTGDTGAVKGILSGRNMIDIDMSGAIKASNATDWNVGTAADGGDLVTDDMANLIVARRTENMLADKLGVRRFTGTGTTIDVPIDNEADGEFVSTNEASQFDLDQPALSQAVLTLVKYSKRQLISYELEQDAKFNFLPFMADWLGRGMAKTHNDLLVNEIQTNGSALELAGTSTIALGDLENAAFGSSVAYYTDEVGSVGWVMQPPTYAAVLALGGTSNRYYSVETGLGSMNPGGRPNLLGYPVHFSNKVDSYGNGQPILFGNWNYVGLYESPTLQLLRDPYSKADYGQTAYHAYFRCDYGVLQSGAIGYVRHINT